MFGFVSKKSFQEKVKFIYGLQLDIISLSEEVKNLKQELHGTQSALYSLISNLNKDLKLDKKGKPVVVKRGK